MLWVAGLVLLASLGGAWTGELLGETVSWFVLSGAALFWSLNEVWEREDYFTRGVKRALAVGVFVEVFVNLAVLPLPLELLLLPVVAVLVLGSTVAASRKGQEEGKRIMDGCLSIAGLVVIGWVLVDLVTNVSDFDVTTTAQLFAMPVWLALGCLPDLYLVGLFAAYESTFTSLELAEAPTPLQARRVVQSYLRANREEGS